MFDGSQTRINIGNDCRTEKAMHGVAARLQHIGLSLIAFSLSGQAMPVVAVTENSRTGVRQVEISDGDIAQSVLGNISPATRFYRRFHDSLNVRRFVRLPRLLPHIFTGVGATKPLAARGLGGQSKLLTTNATCSARHVITPVWSILALTIGVATGARTESLLTTRLVHRERPLAVFTGACHWLIAGSRNADFLPRFCAQHSPSIGRRDFSDVFGCFDRVLPAVYGFFSFDHVRATWKGAWMRFVWHCKDLTTNNV